MRYCSSMWKWAALGVAVWLYLASGAVALSPTWSYFYNGPANDVDISSVIIRGSDGNLYVAGASRSRAGDPSSYDLVVLSLMPNGSVRWVYRYNGPADLEDGAYDMIEGPDGNLYGTGITTVGGTDYDLMVFSLTKGGQLRWLYTYDGISHGNDVGNAIVADDVGNIYIAGMSSRVGWRDNYDWIVLSLTSSGTLRWLDRYNGPGNYHDRAYDIAYGFDGNLYVAGYRVTSDSLADFMVAKYTTSGSREWIRTQNPSGHHDMAYKITFGNDGNVYAAGRLQETEWEFAVVSYDPSGNLRWVYANPNTYGEAYALTYGQTGLYAAGLTQNGRFTVVSLNPSDGSEAWVYQYAPADNEYGRATGILQNSDGSLYAYGGVRFTNDYGSRPTVVKLTRTGSPIFEESFPYFLIYTNKPKEYIDLANMDYPTFYLTAGVSGNGTTQDISFGIEEWEQYGHIQNYDATNESTDHDIWVAGFDEISVTLLWPNQPGIVLEEGDTTYVRFDGIAGHGIAYVESRFSPDGGRNWPHYIGSKVYHWPYPTIADDDSIRWIVDVPATDSGRVKATLYDTQNDSAIDISAYDITVKLARPRNLQVQTSSPWNYVTLHWEDKSNHEAGYTIKRTALLLPGGSSGSVTYFNLPQNSQDFTDNTAQPFSDYLYEVWAYGGGSTSDTVSIRAKTYPRYASGDTMSTSFSNGRNIVYSNQYLSAVYAANDTVFYLWSDDTGRTWERTAIYEALGNTVLEQVAIDVTKRGYPYPYIIIGKRGAASRFMNELVYAWVQSGVWHTQLLQADDEYRYLHPYIGIYGDSAHIVYENDSAGYVLKYLKFLRNNPPTGGTPQVICTSNTPTFPVLCYWKNSVFLGYVKDRVPWVRRFGVVESSVPTNGDFISIYPYNYSYLAVAVGDSSSGLIKLYVVDEYLTHFVQKCGALTVPGLRGLQLAGIDGDIVLYYTVGTDVRVIRPDIKGERWSNEIVLSATAGYFVSGAYFRLNQVTPWFGFGPESEPVSGPSLSFIYTADDGGYEVPIKTWENILWSYGPGGLSGGGTQSLGRIPTYKTVLSPIIPNPTVGGVSIPFSLKSDGYMTLKVYDASGRLIANLYKGREKAGWHTVNWNAEVPQGVYFVVLKTVNYQGTRRLVKMK